MTASQPDRALAAILEGANTAADIAAELGVSMERAGAVLRKLRRRGHVRNTGRRIPSSTGGGGNPLVVWEPAAQSVVIPVRRAYEVTP